MMMMMMTMLRGLGECDGLCDGYIRQWVISDLCQSATRVARSPYAALRRVLSEMTPVSLYLSMSFSVCLFVRVTGRRQTGQERCCCCDSRSYCVGNIRGAWAEDQCRVESRTAVFLERHFLFTCSDGWDKKDA